MKKIVQFIIVLGILFLAFQFGINFFKSKHHIEYELKVDDQIISVDETYSKTEEINNYFFNVSVDGKTFVFDIANKFNKQKRVLEDLEIYEEDELTCIYPIYMKNYTDANIFCNLDGIQYSYFAIKDRYSLDEFINSLDNFDQSIYEEDTKESSYNKHTIYRGNLYDNEILLLYEYKDLLKITKEKNYRINFSKNDVYYNEFGTLIDHYYILPQYENVPEYRGVQIINILNEKISNLYIDEKLSTNLYVNGVVDEKLYFFDKSNLVQFELDPKKETYRITGNKISNAQYYNGNWSTQNIYDFVNQEIKFVNSYPIQEDYVQVFETSKSYYYYNHKYEFYQVYKHDLENKIYLFQLNGIKEISVVQDYIYFIYEDSIYRYDATGMKKLITDNELKYNDKNMYSAYLK